ncbi:MAG TPA: type II toxin-antitoxin system RelE/ParE family toxin [Treponema sp.]|nr:type II toxin-antitoxin system RelE/ParE family toxin [Treponema sp.]
MIKFLKERTIDDPKIIGDALQGNWAPMWRYRVGDYRIICDINEETVTVTVVKIGHRREKSPSPAHPYSPFERL